MPNMNLKGSVGGSSSSSSSGSSSGGGLPKIVLIILLVVVVFGAAAFVLNKAGIVKLWGNKPEVVTTITTPEPIFDSTAYMETAVFDTTAIVEFAAPPEPPAETASEPAKVQVKSPTTVTAPGSRGKPALPEIAAVRPGMKKFEGKILESKPSVAVSAKGTYTIQVSSWESENKAKMEAGILQKKGLPAAVQMVNIYDGTRYRVYVGRFDSEQETRSEAEKIKSLIDGEYLVLYLGR